MYKHARRLLTTVPITLALAAPAIALTPAAAEEPAANGAPNVVVIMLDDVSRGMLDAMPFSKRQIVNRGVRFTNGFVPTSLCCPSRASFLTGKYAHTTGVYGNHSQDEYGGWPAFRASEGETLATALSASGYRTALVGKYLNGFDEYAPGDRIPPGWDDFVAFTSADYYDYGLRGTVNEEYGQSEADYSTDVLAQYASDIVAGSSSELPLFLYFAPYSAHAPFKPAPRHVGTWEPEPLPTGVGESMESKPRFLQKLPEPDLERVTEVRRRQHEMLMSVDEGVKKIFRSLGDRVDNTLFILMSDNGLQLGVHRLTGKDVPYQAASNVPMAMRWDGQIAPGVDNRLMLNLDLTSTILQASSAVMDTDGMSYFGPKRKGTVVEQMPSQAIAKTKHPGYCGYRTKNWLFVEWGADKGRELYHYPTDPHELHSLQGQKEYRKVRQRLRQLAIDECSPTPPGFEWTTA
jgi:N-acetylglucosamine-6-sulfatase